MLRGEEGRLGARGVFRPGGHQLHRPHVFVGQFPQTGLTVLDHLLHRRVLLKRFSDLSLKHRVCLVSFVQIANMDIRLRIRTELEVRPAAEV